MENVAAHPMNGGNGPYSYSKNSTFQRKATEAAKELINRAVEKLDIKILSSSKIIRIADLGCSSGPNTLLAVQNIIDSFERRFCNELDINKSELIIPEFLVILNDLASNDFNQLFTSLPLDRKYFVAGVPGSFYGPLFPKDSLHFVHSSVAMHWLSRVPEAVVDKSSTAWNKGRVYYSNSTEEVARAYEAQFAKDMDKFLKFRAREVVRGGLVALIISSRPNKSSHSETYVNKVYEQLESALIGMAKEGKISNERINSFNFPMYYASPEEIEMAVKRSGCFNLKMLEIIQLEKPQPKAMSLTIRAAVEGVVKGHFGGEILDELFDTVLQKKLEDLCAVSEALNSICLFALLKRI